MEGIIDSRNIIFHDDELMLYHHNTSTGGNKKKLNSMATNLQLMTMVVLDGKHVTFR